MTSSVIVTSPEFITIDPSGRYLYASNGGYYTITVYAINTVTGSLTQIPGGSYETGSRPESIAVDPTGKYLYTANYADNVSAFVIDATTGALTEVPGSPFPAGSWPQSVGWTQPASMSSLPIIAPIMFQSMP